MSRKQQAARGLAAAVLSVGLIAASWGVGHATRSEPQLWPTKSPTGGASHADAQDVAETR